MCVIYPQIAQLDEAKIRISALHAIIDLLLLFGFQLLYEAATAAPPHSPDRQEEEEAGATEEKGDATEDSAQSVLLMLSDFLDSEVSVDRSGDQGGSNLKNKKLGRSRSEHIAINVMIFYLIWSISAVMFFH